MKFFIAHFMTVNDELDLALDNLIKNIQKVDKNTRKLIKDSKFLTFNVQTAVLSYFNK
ncbi:hypothetical protein NUSPORA_00770 [Nucleospora cyclopteri]